MFGRLKDKLPGWAILLTLDFLVLQVSFFLIYWLRYSVEVFPGDMVGASPDLVSYILPDVVITICWIVVFAVFRFYRRGEIKWLFEEVTRVISATSFGMLVLVVLMLDLTDPLAEFKYSLFIYWGVILTGLILNRMYYFRYIQSGRKLSESEYNRMITTQKRVFVIFLDLAAIVAAYVGAFLLRFGGEIPRTEMSLMTNTVFVVMIIRFAMFAYFKVYTGLYRYASINDLLQIIKAVTAGSVILLIPVYFFHIPLFPRSVFILEWLLLVFLAGILRFGIRAGREIIPGILRPGKRLLIVGAGDAGEMIAREIKSSPELPYQPVGFIDDDASKKGMRIHGIPVLGDSNDIQRIVNKHRISQIMIAIPSASSQQMRRIILKCRNARVDFKTIPPLKDILDGKVSLQQVRDIEVNDLLGREQVSLDEGVIRNFITGRRVLVTGAAGSIGSEICRQTARFNPEALLMFDRAENNLYRLEIELNSKYTPGNRSVVVADINDESKVDHVFNEFQPDVVFHAAAYKQVPMMEYFPEEAIKNNVAGTRRIAEAAKRHNASAFVMISTDKAVRPTSIMGASKRIAEMLISEIARGSSTKFVTVRFGNVLGSDGSVVELFTKQIQRGGPVTVTDPRVTRYFMTIREATLLVMMAGSYGTNGQLMVLKMGEQVKIVDLAKDMITLAGLTPNEDVMIEFIGLRPGEKLYEELFIEEEGMLPSAHPKITIARTVESKSPDLITDIEHLQGLANQVRRSEIVDKIRVLVPSYTPTGHILKS